MPLKESDLPYLAGIIDGEGCIRVNNSVRLMIANTDIHLIEWLSLNFGGYYWTNKRSQPRYKILYQWELSAKKACKLLEMVYPFLIIKKAQAKLVLDFHAKYPLNGNNYSDYGIDQAVLKEKLSDLKKVQV